jgi:FtsH-binding integral membrane protein
MGAILVLGLVVSVPSGMTRILGLALFVLWGVYIIVRFIANDFLEPNFINWLYNLSWHCIILVSLWMVGRKYL